MLSSKSLLLINSNTNHYAKRKEKEKTQDVYSQAQKKTEKEQT